MHVSATAANDMAYPCNGFAHVHDTSPTGLLNECPCFMFVGLRTLHVHVSTHGLRVHAWC